MLSFMQTLLPSATVIKLWMFPDRVEISKIFQLQFGKKSTR